MNPLALVQRGQDYFSCTLKKDLPFAFYLTSHSFKAEKELFVEQILLSDLRLDTFELKIQSLTNLFNCYVRRFYFNKYSIKTSYLMYKNILPFFKISLPQGVQMYSQSPCTPINEIVFWFIFRSESSSRTSFV